MSKMKSSANRAFIISEFLLKTTKIVPNRFVQRLLGKVKNSLNFVSQHLQGRLTYNSAAVGQAYNDGETGNDEVNQ